MVKNRNLALWALFVAAFLTLPQAYYLKTFFSDISFWIDYLQRNPIAAINGFVATLLSIFILIPCLLTLIFWQKKQAKLFAIFTVSAIILQIALYLIGNLFYLILENREGFGSTVSSEFNYFLLLLGLKKNEFIPVGQIVNLSITTSIIFYMIFIFSNTKQNKVNIPKTKSSKVIFCTECGSKSSVQQAFCSRCGNSLEK